MQETPKVKSKLVSPMSQTSKLSHELLVKVKDTNVVVHDNAPQTIYKTASQDSSIGFNSASQLKALPANYATNILGNSSSIKQINSGSKGHLI